MNPDDPAVTDIVRHGMVARIATVSRSGRPHVNPLYFVCGRGSIYLGTTDRTLAARNVKADSRVTVLFDSEGDPADRRIVRIRGRAVVRTDTKMIRWYVSRDLRKYIFTRRGLANTLQHARLLPVVARFVSSGEKGKACVLEVRPHEADIISLW